MARMKQNAIIPGGLGSLITTAFPRALQNGSFPNSNPNSTETLGSFSPTSLLETFVPGYSLIHNLVLSTLGFDVTILVSLGVIFWLVARIHRNIWSSLVYVFQTYYTSSITVSSTDEIHVHLITYLAHRYKNDSSSRRLMAETPSKSAWELDSEEASIVTTTSGTTVKGGKEEGEKTKGTKWLNFSNQEAKSQPRFTPALGTTHTFFHNRTLFLLSRSEVSMFPTLGTPSPSGTAVRDREVLILSCLGRSTDPLKAFLQTAKAHYHLGHNSKTIIKRPAPKDMGRFRGRNSWLKIAERPCRPMGTVVLDEKKKMDVLADINEYLDPATARWYANRGIPYRRGYLFYGPPGTGKTSLTFALAGVFGLDIHVVSLLEPTLTEEELGGLFMGLPARCIVLLEDIDTAGLIREEAEPEDEGPKRRTTGGEAQEKNQNGDWNVVDLTKALKKANQMSEGEKKGISLSGLLNIIDGVASHEGRVLVMTTNHPEKLDSALIRPGRVDHQVQFENATTRQVGELFERMFRDDLVVAKASMEQSGILIENGEAKGGEKEVEEEDLKVLAQRFAENIPDGVFSPAEVQGFLLKRKRDPRRAVEEVAAWVEATLEEKRSGGFAGRM